MSTGAKFMEVPFDQWPNRQHPIDFSAYLAVIKQDPVDLTNLHFYEDFDDLDYFKAVIIKTEAGRYYLLRRHRHNGYPGTEISTVSGTPDLKGCLDEILSLLGLSMADVTWTPGNIKC